MYVYSILLIRLHTIHDIHMRIWYDYLRKYPELCFFNAGIKLFLKFDTFSYCFIKSSSKNYHYYYNFEPVDILPFITPKHTCLLTWNLFSLFYGLTQKPWSSTGWHVRFVPNPWILICVSLAMICGQIVDLAELECVTLVINPMTDWCMGLNQEGREKYILHPYNRVEYKFAENSKDSHVLTGI